MGIGCVVPDFRGNVGYNLFLRLGCGDIGQFSYIFYGLRVAGVLCFKKQRYLGRCEDGLVIIHHLAGASQMQIRGRTPCM